MIDYIPSATRRIHESFFYAWGLKKLFEALKDDNKPLLRIGDVT